MDENILNGLRLNETDIDGAVKRLSGDEKLYESLLNAFVGDTTMSELETAIRSEAWDDAFTSAHALKGLAGNMGFVPLFHALGELVILIRNGKISEIDGSLEKVKDCYGRIIKVVWQNNM